jgi:peptide-methionine (S)-S-oxide reductase
MGFALALAAAATMGCGGGSPSGIAVGGNGSVVVSVTSGYTGGTKKDPSYEEVSAGGTGHAESVQIVYDPAKVSYEKLLDVYWHNIDPTVTDRQFCDVGNQYRSAIFVRDAAQRKAAEASLAAVQTKLGKPVKTQIVDASTFYPAEGYHQDYYKKNPVRYQYYRWGCGRDARLGSLGRGRAKHWRAPFLLGSRSCRGRRGTRRAVAGATRGAGRGIAVQLGAAGATVYVTGRTARARVDGRAIEETAELLTPPAATASPCRSITSSPTRWPRSSPASTTSRARCTCS